MKRCQPTVASVLNREYIHLGAIMNFGKKSNLDAADEVDGNNAEREGQS